MTVFLVPFSLFPYFALAAGLLLFATAQKVGKRAAGCTCIAQKIYGAYIESDETCLSCLKASNNIAFADFCILFFGSPADAGRTTRD